MTHIKKKPHRRFFILDKIVLALNILFSLALLLSYLAPTTDPRDFWVIAVLGFGYQFLLAANVFFVLYWVVRSHLCVLISTIGILSGFNVLTSYYKFNNPKYITAKNDSTNIRVMAYNVHMFKGIEELEESNTQNAILQLMNAKQPDVVAMEEYYNNKQENETIAKSVGKAIQSKYYYSKIFISDDDVYDSSGNAIFSKYPIINAGFIASPNSVELEAIYADVKIQQKIFRVYCIHLAAVQVRGITKAYLLNGNIHLDKFSFFLKKLKSAFMMRSRQVDVLKREFEKCPYPYIITGDFNDTPNSYSVCELGAGMKNAYNEKGRGMGVTYYSKLPRLQIDYILTTPQFDVLDYESIDKKISDHRPVMSDLRLN